MDIDADFIKTNIPNIVFEVEGEMDIAQKLEVWLDNSERWIRRTLLGESDEWLDSATTPIAKRIVALEATADALPALDVVITPSGLAVASSSDVAPASKERSAALRKSLYDEADRQTESLIEILRTREWANTSMARKLFRSWVSLPKYARRLNITKDERLLDAIFAANISAAPIEMRLAQEYLGKSLVTECRLTLMTDNVPDEYGPLLRKAAEMLADNMVNFINSPGFTTLPTDIQLYRIASVPKHMAMQSDELRKKILKETPGPQPFNNEIQGALYL